MKKIILLLFIVFFYSCRSELPSETTTGNGRILVKSNIDRSEIYIDGTFTGKFTPDTLELLAVTYRIKVAKKKYFSEERDVPINKNKLITEEFTLEENKLIKNVFIELFSYSFCDTCDIEKTITKINPLKDNRIIIINYPADYPNYDEIFYYDFWNGMIARGDYYDILNIPAVTADGKLSYDFNNDIKTELNKNTNLEIEVRDSLVQGNGMHINVFVDVFDMHATDFNSLVLRNALIEKEVTADTSLPTAKYVLRKFIPDFNGKSLSSISERGRAKFAEFTLVDPHWNKENLYIISFVQNELTKEVLQVGSSN